MVGQALPSSLLSEGRMMLQALLDELDGMPDVEIWLPLDERSGNIRLPKRSHVILVNESDDVQEVLRNLIHKCDAFWPTAPETEGVLAMLARLTLDREIRLLLSNPKTVDLCTDKWATYQCLKTNNIPVVETLKLSYMRFSPFTECVFKPIDGVGCEGNHIVEDAEEFRCVSDQLTAAGHYIVQPYLKGRAVSLSCLFKQGKAWLLTYNEQLMSSENKSFKLLGCIVNRPNPDPEGYIKLINNIAQALPDLWGYVGIDLIETAGAGPVVLEINPRLTTSYSGIRAATGINVAEQIFLLLTGEPDLIFSHSHAIKIAIQ